MIKVIASLIFPDYCVLTCQVLPVSGNQAKGMVRTVLSFVILEMLWFLYLHNKLTKSIMKKLTWILAGLLSVSLLYSFVNARASVNQTTSKYIIVSYSSLGGNDSYVYYSDRMEKIPMTKEELKTTSVTVINLLNRFDSEGYELVSTSQDQYRIHCFLKRVR